MLRWSDPAAPQATHTTALLAPTACFGNSPRRTQARGRRVIFSAKMLPKPSDGARPAPDIRTGTRTCATGVLYWPGSTYPPIFPDLKACVAQTTHPFRTFCYPIYCTRLFTPFLPHSNASSMVPSTFGLGIVEGDGVQTGQDQHRILRTFGRARDGADRCWPRRQRGPDPRPADRSPDRSRAVRAQDSTGA